MALCSASWCCVRWCCAVCGMWYYEVCGVRRVGLMCSVVYCVVLCIVSVL